MSTQVSRSFQDTIKAYLDKRVQEDSLFAQSYAKEGKSIEECCNFIIQEVKNMKVAGLTDDEVFGLAVHYYDEDNLGEIKASNCKVVVNHAVELTEEEKAQARRDAIAQYQKEELAKLKAEDREKEDKPQKKAPAKAPVKASEKITESPSLFDFEDETEE